jgi:hypothetical protein
MPHFREAPMSSGDFWVVALILIGFGFLLDGATGARVAIAIIVMGLVPSLIGTVSDRIWGNKTVVPRISAGGRWGVVATGVALKNPRLP